MKRIQRKRTKGFKLPPNTVCINRPTKWGNPFTEELCGREDAINMFRECLILPHRVYYYFYEIEATVQFERFMWMKENLSDLKKFDYMACFCKEEEPCHGDVLIELISKLH